MDYRLHNRKKLDALMEEKNIDLLVASTPANIYYLCGYKSATQDLLQKTELYAVYEKGKSTVSLVTPKAEIATVLEQVEDCRVYTYGAFYFATTEDNKGFCAENANRAYGSPAEALEAALGDRIAGGRVGIDEVKTSPLTWKRLSKNLAGELYPAANVFAAARTVKTEAEIGKLEKAALIAEKAVHKVLETAVLGMSEKEMAQQFMEEVLAYGAEPLFQVFTIDLRAAMVDTIATDNTMKDGSLIRIDCGCVYENYCSDIARTAVVGRCSSKTEDYYAAILAGEDLAIKAIKPGVSAAEIFEIAVKEVRKGIPHYQRHHCGHGIGLEVYDPPSIAQHDDKKLQPGMVLCIETPYYELGWGGIQIEDPVLVTENGAKILTKGTRNLIKIGGRS